MDSLPLDVLSYIASYGNSYNFSRIYDIDLHYCSACRIQRWWKNDVFKKGKIVKIISIQDQKILYGVLKTKYINSNNVVWCIHICDEPFVHFKYIQIKNDPNYILLVNNE